MDLWLAHPTSRLPRTQRICNHLQGENDRCGSPTPDNAVSYITWIQVFDCAANLAIGPSFAPEWAAATAARRNLQRDAVRGRFRADEQVPRSTAARIIRARCQASCVDPRVHKILRDRTQAAAAAERKGSALRPEHSHLCAGEYAEWARP